MCAIYFVLLAVVAIAAALFMDNFGGARVTLAVVAGMVTVTGAPAWISTNRNYTPGPTTTAATVGYIVCLIALFVLSGFGKGSVFKLLGVTEDERRHWSRNMSGAVIGFATAAGAFGGVGVNMALRQSYQSTGTDTAAFWSFLVIYVAAAVVTWSI